MKDVIFNLRMKVAALRQYLRDNAENMTEDEINRVLDEIAELLNLIEKLERM